MIKESFVILISGGMDSTTLAYKLAEDCVEGPLHLLSIDYGQRHSKELESAQKTAARLKAQHVIADCHALRNILPGSALTSPDTVAVPEGHYTASTMHRTVVPNRNMILLAIASGYAAAHKLQYVGYAAHAGDHAIYSDCRPAFVKALKPAIALATEDCGDVKLIAPFIKLTKADIVRIGDFFGVPWEDTWSCYVGGEKHCGRCGTCVERILAFEEAGVSDPTSYESGRGFALLQQGG